MGEKLITLNQPVFVTEEQAEVMETITGIGVAWFQLESAGTVYANDSTDGDAVLHVVEPDGNYWFERYEYDDWNKYRYTDDGEEEQFWEEED